MSKRFKILQDLTHLIYPNNCLVCESELIEGKSNICSFCDQNIVKTNHHLMSEPSDMDRLFWGRVETESTYAFMVFKKETVSQTILFNLKYKNNAKLGVYFGKRIGKELMQRTSCEPFDAIIPVPLHPKKKFIRGYNQSEQLALGISESMKIPINTQILIRKKHTSSQTSKTRFERWDNVSNVFDTHAKLVELKHVMLVDDVITTGSTIENLILLLKEAHPKIKVSVVTLAIA